MTPNIKNAQDNFTEQLSLLHTHLGTIEELHSRYTLYQYSYCKLVIELARRAQYAEAASKIVQGMMSQLDAMTEGGLASHGWDRLSILTMSTEERQRREEFNEIHGEHLPSDVCPAMQNAPTRYAVLPWGHEPEETLPYIPDDLLTEVTRNAMSIW